MQNAEILKNLKLFVLDMDGTFYIGDKLIEGSLTFLKKLKSTGREFIFFTNNSSKDSLSYRNKLAGMGCFVEEKDIVTSGDVAIKYLNENYSGASVYLVGTTKLEESFKNSGIMLVSDSPEIVTVGFDMTLTYEKINKACKYIREGALFLATHPDLNCPAVDGFLPDCGSICAMIEASTGIKPKYLGKPYSETVEMIKIIAGKKDEEIAFVGDRLYTDIAAAVQNGVTGILVLTGESGLEDVAKSDVKPDYIFESLFSLGEML